MSENNNSNQLGSGFLGKLITPLTKLINKAIEHDKYTRRLIFIIYMVIIFFDVLWAFNMPEKFINDAVTNSISHDFLLKIYVLTGGMVIISIVFPTCFFNRTIKLFDKATSSK